MACGKRRHPWESTQYINGKAIDEEPATPIPKRESSRSSTGGYLEPKPTRRRLVTGANLKTECATTIGPSAGTGLASQRLFAPFLSLPQRQQTPLPPVNRAEAEPRQPSVPPRDPAGQTAAAAAAPDIVGSRQPSESMQYINDENIDEEPTIPIPKQETPRSSTGGYLEPKHTRRPVVPGANLLAVCATTIGTSPGTGLAPQRPSRGAEFCSLPACPQRPLPPANGAEAEPSQPSVPPRDPAGEAAAAAAAPEIVRPHLGRRIQQQLSQLQSSQCWTVAMQLLMTLCLVGYYYAWCKSNNLVPSWIRLTISQQEDINCSGYNSTDNYGTIKFSPERNFTGPFFSFSSTEHSVTVNWNSDYRIAAKVCFSITDAEVKFAIWINNSDEIDRCLISTLGNAAAVHECCTLFGIKNLKFGDAVSVRMSTVKAASVPIACKPSMTSFSLEKRG